MKSYAFAFSGGFMSSAGPVRTVDRRYIPCRLLGHGSMGAVYVATDRLTGEDVALKVVRRVDRNFGADSSVYLSLAREFTVLSTLRHPNIISVSDYGFDDMGQPYVAMELLREPVSITDATKNLTFRYQAALLVQLLQALVYLHRRDVLHGDLKPRNILVVATASSDGTIELNLKVLDFGLSVLHNQPSAFTNAGTPGYMAPELWDGGARTRATDLYAFGAICYEVYAGRRPFDSRRLPSLKHAVQTVAPDLSVLDVPEPMRQLIGALLAKDPRQRPADSSETLTRFLSALDFPLATETLETRESFLQAASFVGRETELKRLGVHLNEALAGRGNTLLVGGESGVGKSRLLDELATQALIRGASVVRGQARREGDSGYRLWHAVLRWLCLFTPLEPDELAVLQAALPEGDAVVKANLQPPLPPLPPRLEQMRFLRTVETALSRLSKPMLILLEDLHWDVGEGLVLLRHLIGVASQLPVCIVATYRDDQRRDLPTRLPGIHTLSLKRLTPSDIAELAESMLGPAGRKPVVVKTLQTETEGNAFFVVETVRAWAEVAGDLSRVGVGPLPQHIWTGGMNGLVRWRLDRVPMRARLFLQAAAVAGRELDIPVLAEVLKQLCVHDSIDNQLALCSESAVLLFAKNGWRFSHVKLRDGVLQALPVEHARRLHACVATAINTVYTYSPREIAPSLAYHWGQAGDTSAERYFSQKAGEHALKRGNYEQARFHFERVVALPEEPSSRLSDRATLLTQLGDVYFALGEFARARACFEESLDLCRRGTFERGIAAALNSLGSMALQHDQPAVARTHFQSALAAAHAIRAKTLILTALAGLAQLHCLAGDLIAALEIAAFVLANPMTDSSAHFDCSTLLARINELVPEDVYDAGVQRGSDARLSDFVDRYLTPACV